MLHDKSLVAFIPTTDPARAKRFYTDVLGLLLVSEDRFALVYEVSNVRLRITPVKEFTPHPFTVLGWDVPDISEMVKALSAKGVRFEKFGLPDQADDGIWTAPGGARVAWFKDPDGNLLSLSQHP